MIEASKTVSLAEYVESTGALLSADTKIVDVVRDDKPFFYFTHYDNLQKVIEGFVSSTFAQTPLVSEAPEEPKRVKIEVATEIDGRVLTQAEQTLLKVRERFNFFQNMNDDEVLSVTSNIGMLRLGKNEILFRQGSDGDQVYFIIRGIVSIQIAKSMTERIEVAKLHAGAVFGEMSPVTKEKRSATVICVDDNTTLLTFRLNNHIDNEKAIAHAKMYQNFTFILADKIVNQNKLLITSHR